MPANPQARMRRESARALARVWADSAYWRDHYKRERDFWRRGALEMFVILNPGVDGDLAERVLNAMHKVPWVVAHRESWVRDATVNLVMLARPAA